MKQLTILFLFVIFLLSNSEAIAQGCVAIRGNSCTGGLGSSLFLSQKEFNVQLGYRHFKSFRHFRGDHEETNRVEDGTEVINKSSFIDLALSYGITDRWSANLILPYVVHDRSSMYEHGGNPPNGLGERHTTTSHGLSDIRLSMSYLLFDPAKHDFNYSVGLGVKLPTGSYDATDLFYNQGPNRDQITETVVDQSIQPGDGGTGLTFDFQGVHPISHTVGISSNFYYLFNFQEANGVATRNGSSVFSCPDQFAARLGAYVNTMSGLNAYLGGRVEGVPAEDAIGSSAGYRRPGYAISAEPGIGYSKSNYSVFASVPIALYRNRTQSYEDKERTAQTGNYRHGDAAFADYLINAGVSIRFGGMGHEDMEMLHIPEVN